MFPKKFLRLFDKTCNHKSVASEPIGVILGPKSEPITFAYINASFIIPCASVPAIANASIMTVGILFIMEDNIAAIKPIPIVPTNSPWLDAAWIRLERTSVKPAFRNPYTTTYIPAKKKNDCPWCAFKNLLCMNC